MADRKFTLFEFHLDGNPQFGPRFGGSRDTEEAEQTMEGDEDGGAGIGRIVAGVAVLLVLAFVARRMRSGDDEGGAAAEEPDVVVS